MMLEKIYKVGPPDVEVSSNLFKNRTQFKRIEFTKELLAEKVEPYWETACNSWFYNKLGFTFGRENAGLGMEIMPLLFDLTFSPGKDYHLHTHQEIIRIVLDNYGNFNVTNTKSDKRNVLIGRIQQNYAALIRELYLVRHMIDKVDSIIKDYNLDLKQGVDFVLNLNHPVAIKHQGATTEHYDNARKDAKNVSGIYTFWSVRNGGNGVDMLNLKEMDEYLVNKDQYKNASLLD